MKVKDLTEEQQQHYNKVVEFCKEKGLEEQLEEATHIDLTFLDVALTKFSGDKELYYDGEVWEEITRGVGEKSNLYQKPEDYKDLLEDSKKPETLYKLKIIYKNNPETMTLNFTEERKKQAVELFNLIKNDMVALGKGEIGYSIISSDVAFAIDVSEIASVFLNEVEDDN